MRTTHTAIFAVLTILLMLPLVSAAAPDATLQTYSDQACPTGSAKYGVSVMNTGDAAETYSVSVNLAGATVAPEEMTVDPGRSKTAYVWVQVPRDMRPGTYSFTATVTASTGETDQVRGTLNVLSCRHVDIEVLDDVDQTVCRNDPATYRLRVTNRGQVEETYALTTTHGSLSTKAVTLAPGASTTMTVEMTSKNAVSRDITVRAASTTSFATDEEVLGFTADTCRGVDLFLSPSADTVCEDEVGRFRATVQNTGSIRDTYTLLANTGGVGDREIELDPGASQRVTINTVKDIGEHSVAVRVTSNSFEQVSASQDATLTVDNCYDLEIAAEEHGDVQISKENNTLITFTLRNTGTQENTYSVAFDGPTWADVRPIETTLDAGASAPLFLYAAPDFFSENGDYTAQMTVTDAHNQVDETVDLEITVGNETVTAEATGGNLISITGNIIRQSAGLASIIGALALLFIGGYWFFRRQMQVEPEDDENERYEDEYDPYREPR